MGRPTRHAVVLATALRSWTTSTADDTDGPGDTRIELRQGPAWEYAGTTTITAPQVQRLLGVLRADLIPAAPTTPVQAAAAVDQILAEWRAEGRRRIRPADWLAVLPRIGQSAAWLADHITSLVDDGYLRETWRPGVHRIA